MGIQDFEPNNRFESSQFSHMKHLEDRVAEARMQSEVLENRKDMLSEIPSEPMPVLKRREIAPIDKLFASIQLEQNVAHVIPGQKAS